MIFNMNVHKFLFNNINIYVVTQISFYFEPIKFVDSDFMWLKQIKWIDWYEKL